MGSKKGVKQDSWDKASAGDKRIQDHSLAVYVLSWGSNSHGQLGLGKEVLQQYTPVLVCALSGVAVTQIAAGATHSLFLTLPGLVYCCGANKSGQLGLNRVDEKEHLLSWRIFLFPK
uniref:Uncharacterized protein n=1 Tax=Scophthalmus maximus TaxID=52904 RepID=A0A8D3CTE1_SCOMX